MTRKTTKSDEPLEPTTSLLLGIWEHLSRRRHFQLFGLLLMMLASGAVELISLGSVVPFLAVLSNPEKLWQQTWVQLFAIRLGYTQPSQLIIPAIVTFATAAVLAAIVRLTNVWLYGRLSAAVGSDLSCEAYRRTLHQPYEVHIQRNSAEVITVTTTQIGRTVSALTSLMQLISAAVVAVSLLTGLLLIDLRTALVAIVLFGGVYCLLAMTVRAELSRNSLRIAEAFRKQLKALHEGLGAIRDVLLDGTQNMYLDFYSTIDRPQRQLQAKNQFLSAFPRYAVEALGLVGIACLGGLLALQNGLGGNPIPMLGAIALGAQRLLPALQQIYGSWSSLQSCKADLQGVLAMLSQPVVDQINGAEPFVFRQAIHMENLFFRYSPEQAIVINGLNLQIQRGERIGLIGSTGSGKSTILDLIMGLLRPASGRLLVDGQDLHDPNHTDKLSAWRKAIAHVPQNIYLADSSIAENIAFGVPHDAIDMDRVRYAAQQAQIAGYIESTPEGYSSFVGENGIRLSGGQRQRIGIARALYKRSSLIILDEATSALDTNTENAVMEAIESLDRNLTLVMIAHRLSTVQRCDRVIRLDKGSVAADGPPHKVLPNIS